MWVHMSADDSGNTAQGNPWNTALTQLSSLSYRKTHQEPRIDTKGCNSQDLAQEPRSLFMWSSYLVVEKKQQTPRGCLHLRILSFAQGTLLSGPNPLSLDLRWRDKHSQNSWITFYTLFHVNKTLIWSRNKSQQTQAFFARDHSQGEHRTQFWPIKETLLGDSGRHFSLTWERGLWGKIFFFFSYHAIPVLCPHFLYWVFCMETLTSHPMRQWGKRAEDESHPLRRKSGRREVITSWWHHWSANQTRACFQVFCQVRTQTLRWLNQLLIRHSDTHSLIHVDWDWVPGTCDK